MKGRIYLFVFIVICMCFIGNEEKVYAVTEETTTVLKAGKEASDSDILYYYIEKAQLTIGLPSEWNAVYLGMPEASPTIKLLGFGDYKKAASDLNANHGLVIAYNEDKSRYFTTQVFSKNTFFKFDMENMNSASEEELKKLVDNIKTVTGMGISDYTTLTSNEITFLCCDLTAQGESIGIMDITVLDSKLYMTMSGLSSNETLGAETKQQFDAFETAVINHFYIGDSYKSLAEDSKAAIAEKEAKLEEQTAQADQADQAVDTADTSTQTTQTVEAAEKSLVDTLLDGTQLFWLFPILLAVVLFAGMKLAKRKEWQEEPLSLATSKGLQGFCAAAIILHHMSQNLFFSGKDAGALIAFVNIGVFMVGVFFFFSGYGLLKSFATKENYLKGFLRKRLPTILVPFYVCNLIFILVTLADGAKFSTTEWIVYLTGFILLNAQMWYIVEIFFFYLAFYIIFKLVKKKNAAIALLGVFTIAMIALGVYRTNGGFGQWFQGEWWFNSTLLFFVGVLFCQFETKLIALAKKVYWLVLPGMAAGTVILYIKTMSMLKNYRYGTSIAINLQLLVWQVLMITAFVLTLVLISLKVKFSNSMLTFLGKISLELYLIHNVFITYLRGTIVQVNSNFVYITLVILFAILFASLLNPFDQKLISLISGRRKAGKAIKEEGSNKVAMTAVTTEKNHFVDCFRLLAAFLVVCIHIPFPGTTGSVVISFAKTAVPFFLVISGYLCYRDDNTAYLTRLKKQTKKIYYLFLCANLFYLVLMFFLNSSALQREFTNQNLVAFLLYNENPFADHLWYLGSMLYALLLIMLLTKLKLHKYAMYLAPICLAAYFILSRIGNREYYVYRNFLFVTFGYMMMGCLIRRYQDILLKICKSRYLFLALGVLCITNVLELSIYHTAAIPFFSAELLVYVIVMILLKYPNVGKGKIFEKLGSKCSLSIYIIHFAVIQILMAKGSLNNTVVYALAPFIVFVISLVIAFFYQLVKEKKISRR